MFFVSGDCETGVGIAFSAFARASAQAYTSPGDAAKMAGRINPFSTARRPIHASL
jgi:hypothetical protein